MRRALPAESLLTVDSHLNAEVETAAAQLPSRAAPPLPPVEASAAAAEQEADDVGSDTESPRRPKLEDDDDEEDEEFIVQVDAEDLSPEEFQEREARAAELQSHKEQLLALRFERERSLAAEQGAGAGELPPLDGLDELGDPLLGSDPSILEARAAAEAAVGGMEASAARWRQLWPTRADVSESGAPCKFAAMALKVVYEAGRTGFEDEKDFSALPGQVIAGRYVVKDTLGSAAFSSALGCDDLATGRQVCLKVVKNNKEYVDQSIDEVKLLNYINARMEAARLESQVGHGSIPGLPPVPRYIAATADQRLLRLHDFFYYKEHLFLVTELLKDNLYEFQKYLRTLRQPNYFTMPRIQRVAKQCLQALAFIHSLGILHSDLKPENILIASYSKCNVKVIDFGSSCFITDHLTTYIQSRSYRAPEVVLGLPYGPKIDVWSLGCILCEMLTGRVLFVNDAMPTILARMQALLGPMPRHMLR